MRVPVPPRLLRAGGGRGRGRALRRGASATSNLLCCDVGGTSSDLSVVHRRRAVAEHDVRARARHARQRAVGRAADARRGRRQHRRGHARRARSGRARERRRRSRPGLLRPRRHRADDDRRLPGDGHHRPGRFNAGAMELDADLALEAFEALDTPLDLGAADLASRTASASTTSPRASSTSRSRDGVDPRDFSLVAFGAAGPADAAGDARRGPRAARDRAAVPRAVLGAGPAEHRPRVLRQPERVHAARRPTRPPRSRRSSTRWRQRLREPSSAETRRGRGPPQFDGRLVGQSLGDAVRRGARGPIDARGRRADDRATSTTSTSRASGTASTGFPVEGVTYRVQLIVRPERCSTREIDRATPRRSRPTGTSVELRYMARPTRPPASTSARTSSAGNVVRGPGDHPRADVDNPRIAGQVATVGGYGEILIERAARELHDDHTHADVAERRPQTSPTRSSRRATNATASPPPCWAAASATSSSTCART